MLLKSFIINWYIEKSNVDQDNFFQHQTQNLLFQSPVSQRDPNEGVPNE